MSVERDWVDSLYTDWYTVAGEVSYGYEKQNIGVCVGTVLFEGL